MSRSPTAPGSGRPGAALVAALALLTLASALLAGAFVSASAAARAVHSARASAMVDGAAQRALAERVSEWDAGEYGLAVGASLDRPFARLEGSPPVRGRTRVHRLTPDRFIVSVDVVAGDSARPGARRRVRLIMQAPPADSAGGRRVPAPIARWSRADLY